MKRYDIIIAGGGAAGLSLALHLIRSPLHHQSILIVDKDSKERNDRTWGFWTRQPTLFDDVVYHSWNQLQIVGESFERNLDLHEYCYKMIRGIDFYRFARQELSAYPNVEFLQGTIQRIEDRVDGARVMVDGQTLRARWVFDSTSKSSDLKRDPSRYHYLKLHFKGWEIETPEPAFNPQAATLLDFRTPQHDETRFFYVLPVSERRALVEFTLFSATRLSRDEYEQALKAYLETTLGIKSYRILSEESGSMPITDQPFPRRTGQRVMTIGAKAGRIKPTTGYAFMRIQHDSAAIVRSLLEAGHPFDVPADSRRYRLYDSMMLQIMSRHGGQIKPIFTAMFKNNPIERNLRFLDEVASLWENVRLIATLPPRLFLQALFRLVVLRRVSDAPTRVPARVSARHGMPEIALVPATSSHGDENTKSARNK
jgi:lycopene beta-cyclase